MMVAIQSKRDDNANTRGSAIAEGTNEMAKECIEELESSDGLGVQWHAY